MAVAAYKRTIDFARVMGAQAASATLRSYAKCLLAAVVFPVQWASSWKFASRHQDVDRNARPLMAVAIVIGIVLAGIGGFALWSFQESATEGIYDSLDDRLRQALGESEYRSHVENAQVSAAGSEAQQDALLQAAALEGNHQLYLRVSEAVQAQDDAAAKQLIEERPAGVEYPDMDERAAGAFQVKDSAVADMQGFMIWILYPGLVGVLFAPLVWAESHALRRGFRESETVGFKPYPGGAMAIVLLLGAFGVPALFLASWAFADMRERERFGQISL